MIKVISNIIPKSKFGIALSGGVDSIAAAHFLLKGKKDFECIHVNAKYIDQDDECEIKVRNFCNDFNIPLTVKTVKEKYTAGSVEEFCRNQRYKLFQETQLKHLIVCHHLDDCVESYLMNCFNGNPTYFPIPFQSHFGQLSVVRPFLKTNKVDFYKYVKKNNLEKYVTEDELNSDTTLQRNWLRKELIPLIKTRYPGIKKIVFKKIDERQKELHKYFL